MKTLKKLYANKNFLGFVLASGFAALVNFESRIWIGHYTSYATSIVLAYILGIITAFLLCRRFVFTAEKNSTSKQIVIFILVNILAIVQTLVVSLVLYHYVLGFWFTDQFVREEVAHFIGICVPAFTSYLGHKFWTFR